MEEENKVTENLQESLQEKIPESSEDEPQAREDVAKPSAKPKIKGANVLMMNRWDVSGVVVKDPGLKPYLNVSPVILPKTSGRYSTLSLRRKNISIVERLINKLMVTGHKGKKHEITSDHNLGRYMSVYNAMKEAFEIIEKKTKLNPIQVLATAVENSAMYEEVAAYRMGGMIARKAVIVSPRRRIDMALRFMAQGIFRSSFKKKIKFSGAIANELIDIYNNDPKTLAIRERQRLEREADGAR